MIYDFIISIRLEIISQIFSIYDFICHPIDSTKKFLDDHEGVVIYYVLNPINLMYYVKNSWKGLISLIIAWMLTNGWAYILAFTTKGVLSKIAWWYIGFLYLPFTPEKIITIPLGIFIHGVLWDRKTLKQKIPTTEYGYKCYIK